MKQRCQGLWLLVLAVITAAVLLIAVLLTSPRPWVDETRTATAEQVDVARALAIKALADREAGRPSQLTMDESELASIAVLINQSFSPNRIEAGIEQGVLRLTLSRPVLFRWINLRADISGRHTGFPPLRLTIGALTLAPWLSGAVVQTTRLVLIARGAEIPDIDTIIRSIEVNPVEVKASIIVPDAGLIEQLTGSREALVKGATVASIYCRLAQRKRSAATTSLAITLSHALDEAERLGKSGPNRDSAALIALAMLVVDPRVGQLAGDAAALARRCTVAAPETTLRGRADLAKHWALSAALTVATGEHIASAMGVWKELADSLTSEPAATARTGFSFVDLAADRAGYFTARALADPTRATASRARLMATSEDWLLPLSALELDEGLDTAEFTRRFGATDDPRYEAALSGIDQILASAGIS